MDDLQSTLRAPAAAAFGPRQRNLMLIILMLVGVCAVADRAIVGILLEPIKKEFGLSDGQLGLLSGLAFALAHAVVAIPAGVLADRTSRRKLIAASLFFWSLLTALCGVAQNFVQLLAFRMGVGAGEAGGQAAMMSTVSDLFPPEKRATAISIYYLNSPIAMLLSGAIGGVIAGTYGWRAAMAAAAIPGFILTVVLLFCRDVPREAEKPDRTVADAAPPMGEVLKFMGSQHALLHLMAAAALITVVMSGPGAFSYSFFIRYHHMNLKTLGPLLGSLGAFFGLIIIPGSGLLSDWLGKRDANLRLWTIAGVLAVASPIVMAGYVAPMPYALALYLAQFLIQGAWLGPLYGAAQNLAKPRMRSTVAGILFVVNGLVGFGLGPVLVGSLSDAFSRHYPGQGLRISLVLTTTLGFWAAAHLVLATRTLKRDLAKAKA